MTPNLDRFDGYRDPLSRPVTALEDWQERGYDPAEDALCGAMANDYDPAQAGYSKEETR